MQSQQSDSFMKEFHGILELAEEFARGQFPVGNSFQLEPIRMASSSTETGYFIFVAGGNNVEEQFFKKAKITVGSGVFEPGIYLLQDQIGGSVLMPSDRVNPATLEKENFPNMWPSREEELETIKDDFERFFAAHYTHD